MIRSLTSRPVRAGHRTALRLEAALFGLALLFAQPASAQYRQGRGNSGGRQAMPAQQDSQQSSPQPQYGANQSYARSQQYGAAQQPSHNQPYGASPYGSAQPYGGQGRGEQYGAVQPYGRAAQYGQNERGGSNGQFVSPGHPGQTQQHLGQWMDAHRGMALDQQQRALDQEPGFHQLRPEVQDRLHNQLTQLNRMSPGQLDHTLARNEAMERLQPEQRQQVRGALSQLGSLPPDRRSAVSHAFHTAMNMPEGERQAWLNSPQIRGQFNDQERGAIGNLLSVQPAAAQAGLPGFVPRTQPYGQAPQ